MASRSYRVKKSRSILISLYSLTSLSIVAYSMLLFAFLYKVLLMLEPSDFKEVFLVLWQSMQLIFESMLIAIPFTVAMAFLVIHREGTRVIAKLQKLTLYLKDWPVILFGLIFLYLMGANLQAVKITLAVVAVSSLSHRWIMVSKGVSLTELETARSLGMNFWQMLYVLYLKQFLRHYVLHFVSVNIYLLSLVTPLVCIFYFSSMIPVELLSVSIFNNLGQFSGSTSLMVVVLVAIHVLKVCLDRTCGFFEVEHG